MSAPAVPGRAWPGANYLLSRVGSADRPTLSAMMTEVPLDLGQVLYEPGQRLDHVYLPTAGIISLIVVMPDGECAETAVIGREGAAGLNASGFVDAAFTRFQVQVSGTAQRVSAAAFEDMVDASVEFCSAVSRYRDVLMRTTLQSVACNALHDVRRRCARWILQMHDRTDDGTRLPITQEFLAAMLGVKRNAVSKVARDLQRDGVIEYRRGKIAVTDRARLQEIACDCYGIIHGEIDKLLDRQVSSECDD